MVSKRIEKYRSEVRKKIAALSLNEYIDFPIADKSKVSNACFMERLLTGDQLIVRRLEEKEIVRVYRLPNDD